MAKLSPPEQGETQECQKVPKKTKKNEKQMDKATFEQIRDQQQWRQCYVAHYGQWQDPPAGDKKNRHALRHRLHHSHSFLGEDICQQPHL
jgi:hypothetical protein